jgi:protein gp37
MALKSKIEWTENTWNPVTGCTKLSEGCENCYAQKMAFRLQKMGNEKYSNGFNVTLHEYCLNDPLTWKKPSRVFVNSMSDLFHEDIPLEYIQRVFAVMRYALQHTFQILTKRTDRLVELSTQLSWTPNIWQGITVENRRHIGRIDHLRSVPAYTKFISFEPLLGDIGVINLSNIDWAIVGGESGPRARHIDEQWVINIKKQCEEQDVLFYFKQWGGTNKKEAGRKLLGRTWDDIPATVAELGNCVS